MINTIFNHDMISSSKYTYEDYTSSTYTDIHKLDVLNDSTYFDYIKLENDTKIESVSFNLYGSENYWDLLIAINHIDPLFGMVYGFDIISDNATKSVAEYTDNIYIGTLPTEHIEYLKEKKEKEFLEKNEALRVIKAIKPEKLQDFLKILRDEGKI